MTFGSINSLKAHLKKLGFKDLKDKDLRSVFVLTDENRTVVFNQLLVDLNGKKNASRTFGGSLGHIDVGNFRVGVKPLKLQGGKSAGVDNEVLLVNAINAMIAEHGTCDVTFKAGSHKFTVKEVKEAVRVGEDTAGRKKSDVNINTVKGKSIPISIKKDNAEYWESADTFWRTNAVQFLNAKVADQTVITESIGGGAIRMNKNIGIEATQEEALDVIFGSDILKNKGCVITKTFGGTEFSYDGKTNAVIVDVSNIITKLGDVPQSKEVWFLIRNDSTRKSIPGFPGTRCLATYSSRINQNVIKIPVNHREPLLQQYEKSLKEEESSKSKVK